MSGSTGRVLLIGLDGADWRLLTPMIDSGYMPNLQRIIEQGTSGRLAAPAIPQMDVAWTDALTGVHAYVHGILDPEVASAGGQSVRRTSASDRRVPVLWDIASDTGIVCVHFGWGSVIGDSGMPDIHAVVVPNSAAHSTQDTCDLVDQLVAWVVPIADARDQIVVDRFRALMTQSHTTVQQSIIAMNSRPWRLAAVRLATFGELLRDFLRFMPPAPTWVLPRRASMFARAVEHVCRLHDALIGQLVAAAGDDRSGGATGDVGHGGNGRGSVSVVVASPRGTLVERLRSDPTSVGTATLPNRPAGIIMASGSNVRRDALAFGAAAIDLCPTVLALLGCACPAHVHGRVITGIGNADAHAAPSGGTPALHPAVEKSPQMRLALSSAEVHAVERRRAIALADSYADAGLWRRAAEVMRQHADEWPADAHVALRCIALLLDAGQCEAAAERLASLPRMPLELTESHALIGASLYAARERHRDALGLLQAEQRRQESAGACVVSPALHLACARSQHALGLLVEAERSCELALRSDPDCRDAHVVHAQVLYATERYADAVSAGLRAVALAHFDPQMHFLVGTALAALGRAREAVAELLIAVEQDPGLVAAYRRLAAVHLRQLGNVDAAQRYAVLAGRARAAKCDSIE